MVTPAEAQAAFLRMMCTGWASGEKPKEDSDGFKVIEVVDGDFRLRDRWTRRLPGSNASAGSTSQWYRDVHIWMMFYGGWYDDEGSVLVKRALKQNYENGVFVGGRGPVRFINDSFVYENVVQEGLEDFTRFSGRDRVTDVATRTLHGYHEYSGLWLFQRNGDIVDDVPPLIDDPIGGLVDGSR